MSNITNTISRGFHGAAFAIKKKSPVIMLTVGIVGTGYALYKTRKAALKEPEVAQEIKDNIEKVKEKRESSSVDVYSDKEYKKELAIEYIKGVGKYGKLYGIPLAVETVSLACIINSHVIMEKRNGALALAYAGLKESFDHYKQSVAEKVGEHTEENIRHAVTRTEEEDTKDVVDEDSFRKINRFSRFFAQGHTTEWTQDDNYNLMFIKGQEEYANQRLRTRGYMFWNEVLEALGFDPVPEGQYLGWVYDRDPNSNSDDRIDFRTREVFRQNEDGQYEKTIILDFNVQGDIINDFTKWQR